MVRKWADDLSAKTGRTLDQWANLVLASKLQTRAERVEWLKTKHKFGTVASWQIAEYATDNATWDGDADVYLKQAVVYVDAMFAGKKAGLRPMFDKLVPRPS